MSENLRITIIGCGVVGACIAYELSALDKVEITVLEARSLPGEGASAAALGICMGVISHKTKGRNWRLRSESLRRYETLLAELNIGCNEPILYNRHGIVKLCGGEESWATWETLRSKRQKQGYCLDLWEVPQVQACFPSLNVGTIQGAIFSPGDRQVNPTQLIRRLVQVAQQRGVRFFFNTLVQNVRYRQHQGTDRIAAIEFSDNSDLKNSDLKSDYVILTAGIGNNTIAATLPSEDNSHPKFQAVLGQAWEVLLPRSLWAAESFETALHPVLTVRDIHFVPLGSTPRYWVGATVEFPLDENLENVQPSKTIAAELWQQAIEVCPLLAQGIIQRQWWGLRPRPLNQSAPVLQWSSTVGNLLWATGHYRNGIFLAPATALWVKQQILNEITDHSPHQTMNL